MCRIHSRKEHRRGHACIRLDPLAGVNTRLGMRKTCWGWGKEQHLYNTYLPIPSFLLPKNSLQGSQPTQVVAGSLLDVDWLHCRCALRTSSGSGSRKQHPLPSAITTCLPVVPGSVAKRGVFSETLSSLKSRTPCQVRPKSSRARSWLEVSLNISHSLFTQLLKLLL